MSDVDEFLQMFLRVYGSILVTFSDRQVNNRSVSHKSFARPRTDNNIFGTGAPGVNKQDKSLPGRTQSLLSFN